MEYLFNFLLNAVISGGLLWLASKLTSVNLLFKEAVLVAGLSAFVALVPGPFGWILSMALFFYLLRYFTRASVWPDLILLFFISKLVSIAIVFALLSLVL